MGKMVTVRLCIDRRVPNDKESIKQAIREIAEELEVRLGADRLARLGMPEDKGVMGKIRLIGEEG